MAQRENLLSSWMLYFRMLTNCARTSRFPSLVDSLWCTKKSRSLFCSAASSNVRKCVCKLKPTLTDQVRYWKNPHDGYDKMSVSRGKLCVQFNRLGFWTWGSCFRDNRASPLTNYGRSFAIVRHKTSRLTQFFSGYLTNAVYTKGKSPP